LPGESCQNNQTFAKRQRFACFQNLQIAFFDDNKNLNGHSDLMHIQKLSTLLFDGYRLTMFQGELGRDAGRRNDRIGHSVFVSAPFILFAPRLCTDRYRILQHASTNRVGWPVIYSRGATGNKAPTAQSQFSAMPFPPSHLTTKSSTDVCPAGSTQAMDRKSFGGRRPPRNWLQKNSLCGGREAKSRSV